VRFVLAERISFSLERSHIVTGIEPNLAATREFPVNPVELECVILFVCMYVPVGESMRNCRSLSRFGFGNYVLVFWARQKIRDRNVLNNDVFKELAPSYSA
jgi:hypothetical protein